MKQSSKAIKNLRTGSEALMSKTSAIQQVLAQQEASLSRKENQKIQEKTNKT